MKCPSCKAEGFTIVKPLKKNSFDYRKKEMALFGCPSCNYTEVIG